MVGNPPGLSPETGSFVTRVVIQDKYRFLLGVRPLMRNGATVNAWIACFSETVNA